MKKIAKTIACWCLSSDKTDDSELEVVTYGLELILGTLLKYLILLGIGCFFGKGMEVAIILSVIAVFRTFAGGVHGKTSVDCFLYMLMVCVMSLALSELSRNLKGIIIPGIGYMICLYMVYKYIPLQSLKNPISDVCMVKKKKVETFLVIMADIILFVLLNDVEKWLFLYPIIIENLAIMLESKKRRGLP